MYRTIQASCIFPRRSHRAISSRKSGSPASLIWRKVEWTGPCKIGLLELFCAQRCREQYGVAAFIGVDCDLELAVIDSKGVHAFVFPCRRNLGGWLKSRTEQRVEISPTHWRQWTH
jgi:hypothetical protein